MKVGIDATRCSGHGLCYAVAGELFEDDDNGFGRVREEFSQRDIPESFIAAAESAASNCPEQAIHLAD
jgi:ferredoxin